MPMKTLLAAAFLAALVSGGAAQAAGPAGFARSFASSPAVRYDMAMADPIRSAVEPQSAPTLTRSRAIELSRVNRLVNTAVRGLDSYLEGFAPDLGDTVADRCHDCADLKRDRLVALGWPAGSLKISYALTGEGKVERVLVVATDRGQVILGERLTMVGKRATVDTRSSASARPMGAAGRAYADI